MLCVSTSGLERGGFVLTQREKSTGQIHSLPHNNDIYTFMKQKHSCNDWTNMHTFNLAEFIHEEHVDRTDLFMFNRDYDN